MKWQINLLAVLIIASLSLRPDLFKEYYSSNNKERQAKLHNTYIYKNIRKYLPANIKIVMNVKSFEDTELMFYHNDITAYHWWIPENDLRKLAEKNYL
jgi:hypothetical protein